VVEQVRGGYHRVAALFEGDAEDLARLELGRLEGRVHPKDGVAAAPLGPEQIQRHRLVAGRDHPVGHFAPQEPRRRQVDNVAEGDPIAVGAHAVGAARAGVRRRQGRQLPRSGEVRLPQRATQRQAHGGAGGRDVLEGSRRRQAERQPQLAHQLPRVQRIQQVDIPGRAVQHLEWQPPVGVHPRRDLVRVDAVAQRELSGGNGARR
jgi:hypothetical protein